MMKKLLVVAALCIVAQAQAMPGKKPLPSKPEKKFIDTRNILGNSRPTPADSFVPSYKTDRKPWDKPRDVPGKG